MSEILVAVPSNAPAGLNASPSAHFGHCDAYTIAKISDNEIKEVAIEYNEGHEHGGCIVPVRDLASKGVTVLIAGGMGMGPLNAMHQMGMKVYYATGYLTVKHVLDAYLKGELQEFATNNLCQGGCGRH